MCCNVLQCIAVYCSVLQCVSKKTGVCAQCVHNSVLQCSTSYFSSAQSFEARCSVFQCVAVSVEEDSCVCTVCA